MKQVIENKPEATTTFCKDVNGRKYYGVNPTYNQKGFIIQEKYREGLFSAVSGDGLTRRNGWDLIKSSSSLPQYIENLIKADFKVFEFDSPQELFAWLAE